MQRRRGDSSLPKAVSNNGSSEDYTKAKVASKRNARLANLVLGVGTLLLAFLMVLAPNNNNRSDNNRNDNNQTDIHRENPPLSKKEHTKPHSLSSKSASAPSSVVASQSSVEYQIVFSTGCSTYQDWQSYLFFYQAMASGQPGTVTRIVSGCDEKEEAALQQIFDEQIAPMTAPGRFRIHFTPDYSKIKEGQSFVYFNKPFGMRHWLQNALGFPNKPENEDAIVILMDPDQIFLRPFVNNDFSNTEWKFIPKGQEPRTKIEHGKPMGQMYGFGMQWKSKVNMTLVSPNEPSPIDKMSFEEARAGYIVGPPYVATARDMYKIVTKWCEFAIPVHDQYPHLLAEMFAYCLGAAHQRLAHQTAVSFMVSDTTAGGEGWNYVDRMPRDKVCSPDSIEDLPNVIHFCQRYGLGPYFFGKRRLPKDFLKCESPLLADIPVDFDSDRIDWPDGSKRNLDAQHSQRNRFMLCHLIPVANAAATYFKKNHCDQSTANYAKTLVFNDDALPKQ